MFWPPFVFNLCVGLLLAAYLLRAVRRFERRADAVMAGLDRWEAEEFRKYDIAEAEIKASMRAKGDAAIAEMQAKGTVQPHSFLTSSLSRTSSSSLKRREPSQMAHQLTERFAPGSGGTAVSTAPT